MHSLVIGTNNRDKVREIARALEQLPIRILSKADFPSFPDPEETGHTLTENALIKARAIYQAIHLPTLSDDTGLEVDALQGAPGVVSARFAGPNATYADNCRHLLTMMQSFPNAEQRTARFRTVIALVWSEDDVEIVEGTCDGIITVDPAGTGGFGYDPVFFYPPAGCTFAEMSLEGKNRVSHRGRAIERAVALIRSRLA